MLRNREMKKPEDELDDMLSCNIPELSEAWQENLMKRIKSPEVAKSPRLTSYAVLVVFVVLVNGLAAIYSITSFPRENEMSRTSGLRAVSDQFLIAGEPMHKHR